MTFKTYQSSLFFSRYCSRSSILFVSVVMAVALSGCLKYPHAVSPSSATLELPNTVSLGKLWLIEDPNCFTCGNGEEFLGAAIGTRTIKLRSGWFIRLIMPQQASWLMPYFKHPSLTAIGAINLEGSDIKDDDLQYLAKINLRSLNLSRTGITGSGLKYLKPHQKWFSIQLQDCKALDPKYLVHFKGWQRATITLWSQAGSADPKAEKLWDDARRIICDNKPESACATQIR